MNEGKPKVWNKVRLGFILDGCFYTHGFDKLILILEKSQVGIVELIMDVWFKIHMYMHTHLELGLILHEHNFEVKVNETTSWHLLTAKGKWQPSWEVTQKMVNQIDSLFPCLKNFLVKNLAIHIVGGVTHKVLLIHWCLDLIPRPLCYR